MRKFQSCVKHELRRAYARMGPYDQLPRRSNHTLPYLINDGLCDAFAQNVVERAQSLGNEAEVLAAGNMTERESDRIDERFWPGDHPPELHAAHAWIYCEGRHYDAECPEGASTFIGLPLVRRTLVQNVTGEWLKTPPALGEVVRMVEQDKTVRTKKHS